MQKLNLGSGTDYRAGWVNVDKGNCRCDVQHDIEDTPWPFEDSSADEMALQHVMEHIHREKFIDVVREMYRVGKHNAIVNITSPYAGSDNFWTDPDHKLPLTPRSFDYFDSTKALGENGKIYGWDDVVLRVEVGQLAPCPPNGPNVVHRLRIIKEDA